MNIAFEFSLEELYLIDSALYKAGVKEKDKNKSDDMLNLKGQVLAIIDIKERLFKEKP